MKPVTESSTVAAIKYDEQSKTLSVRFHSGGTYHYENVPPETFAALEKAPSVGKFLHAHIKGKHQFRKE